MADYVLARRGRNILSSFLHVIFNIALGLGSVALTVTTNSWIPGIILVAISKWRTFAVHPHYLWMNIKASLVDFIVGVSFVLITYASGPELMPIHFALAVAYVLWLIVLKPRSSEFATEMQSLVAVFLGSAAATLMTASANSIFLTLACFIIGYAAAHHVLIQSSEDDSDYTIVPLAAGLLAAEIAWLFHSWLIVYTYSNLGMMIPQLTIIMTVTAFIFGYVYKSIRKNEGRLDPRSIALPLIWSVLLISFIVLWFSVPKFNV